MLLANTYHIPGLASLAVVAVILTVGLVASLTGRGRSAAALQAPLKPHQLAMTTAPRARRALNLLVGGTTLAVGAAMIFFPGPALLVMPVGLIILASQFLWARRLFRRVTENLGAQPGEKRDDGGSDQA